MSSCPTGSQEFIFCFLEVDETVKGFSLETTPEELWSGEFGERFHSEEKPRAGGGFDCVGFCPHSRASNGHSRTFLRGFRCVR